MLQERYSLRTNTKLLFPTCDTFAPVFFMSRVSSFGVMFFFSFNVQRSKLGSFRHCVPCESLHTVTSVFVKITIK